MKTINQIKLALSISLLIMASACDKDDTSEQNAPDVVTNVVTEVSDQTVTLLWNDPEWDNNDLDGHKIEITFTPTSNNINQPISVNKWAEKYIINGLTNGVEYTFLLTAVSKSGKRSEAVSIKATPTEGNIFNPDITYGEFTDTRDGKVYKTVQIGNQTWLAENLAYEIPGKEEQDDDIWEETGRIGDKDLWCYFNNDKNTYRKYGVLYQANAALNACPTGWHIPSAEEWEQLQTTIQNNNYNTSTAKSLASQYGWHESVSSVNVGDNPASNNSSGFSGLGASGRDDYSGGFFEEGSGSYIGDKGTWWTTTTGFYSVQVRYIRYSSGNMSWDNVSPGNGYSVRCIQD
jgi:uncharacterized protein (TIGR02145 family)